MEFLIENGVDVNKECKYGWTALINGNQIDYLNKRMKVLVPVILILYYLACKNKHLDLVKYLIEKGADVDKKINME